eukprot:4164939-Prymnesium_polylepis.1
MTLLYTMCTNYTSTHATSLILTSPARSPPPRTSLRKLGTHQFGGASRPISHRSLSASLCEVQPARNRARPSLRSPTEHRGPLTHSSAVQFQGRRFTSGPSSEMTPARARCTAWPRTCGASLGVPP